MPEYAVGLLEGAYGDLAGATVVVLGAPYRGGVKETAFSGVFPTVAGAHRARRDRRRARPALHRRRAARAGPRAVPRSGEPVDAAVVQADHAEYRDLSPADLPGVKVLVDGRRITDPARWDGVQRRVIGA